MAPCSRIQRTAALVSRPPEKAMPTFSPAGRWLRILVMSGADGFERFHRQPDGLLDLALADDQWGHHADGPRPSIVEHDALLQARVHDVSGDLFGRVKGDHQAHAADRRD